MMAKLAGARIVICIEGNKHRIDMAKRFGADEVLDMTDDKFHSLEARAARIAELVGPKALQVAIECSGHPAAVEEGVQLLTRNGRYLLLGTWAGAGTVPLSPFQVVHKALRIVGSTYSTPKHYYEAARLIETNYEKFPLTSCVTHRFTLDRVEEAFTTVLSGSAIKVVIEPQLQE
jgi:threonine dehydrogenase-like Zn-dependent dehydrogenase